VELYLIRHTQPDVASGLCYGQTDLSLAEDYCTDLTRLKAFFSDISISHVYSSPLQRCQRLAKDLFAEKVVIEKRLMEINFGEWEMRAWSRITKHSLDRWAKDLTRFTPPGGESLFALDCRVAHFYQTLLTQHVNTKDANIAIVCHAGVIRCLLSRLMKMPLDGHLNWQIDYGSVSKIIVEEQFVRLCYSNALAGR